MVSESTKFYPNGAKMAIFSEKSQKIHSNRFEKTDNGLKQLVKTFFFFNKMFTTALVIIFSETVFQD